MSLYELKTGFAVKDTEEWISREISFDLISFPVKIRNLSGGKLVLHCILHTVESACHNQAIVCRISSKHVAFEKKKYLKNAAPESLAI